MTTVLDGERSPTDGGWTATLVGAIGICLWATETVLVTFTSGLPPFEIAGLAFAGAALLSPLAWWITGDSPGLAFRQPWAVWALNVPCLVCYHACIYFAVHRVPAAPAALLQGCTPLLLVFGSALMPGQHLRWWHVAGVVAGIEGLICLSMDGDGLAAFSGSSGSLALIGFAAGLWGIYSLVSSRLGSVPTSAMGVFYGASAAAALLCHGLFEQWVNPTSSQWAAITALGVLPMGLALFCWDFGLKNGDVRTLGVVSYVEPLIGAGLVIALGQGELRMSMLVAGFVIIGGAVVGSANYLDGGPKERASVAEAETDAALYPVSGAVPISLRLPPELWKQVVDISFREGVPAQAFVRECIERALRDDDDRIGGGGRLGIDPRTVEEVTGGTTQPISSLRVLTRGIEQLAFSIEEQERRMSAALFDDYLHRKGTRQDELWILPIGAPATLRRSAQRQPS